MGELKIGSLLPWSECFKHLAMVLRRIVCHKLRHELWLNSYRNVRAAQGNGPFDNWMGSQFPVSLLSCHWSQGKCFLWHCLDCTLHCWKNGCVWFHPLPFLLPLLVRSSSLWSHENRVCWVLHTFLVGTVYRFRKGTEYSTSNFKFLASFVPRPHPVFITCSTTSDKKLREAWERGC